MAVTVDPVSRYLELAIEFFERAQSTHNPQLRAKLRERAEVYRDKALQLLDRALEPQTPTIKSPLGPDSTIRRGYVD